MARVGRKPSVKAETKAKTGKAKETKAKAKTETKAKTTARVRTQRDDFGARPAFRDFAPAEPAQPAPVPQRSVYDNNDDDGGETYGGGGNPYGIGGGGFRDFA